MMTVEEIRKRLLHILTSTEFTSLQIEFDQIDDDTSMLNDLGLDSMQLLELIVAMENAFAIRINTKRLQLELFDKFHRLVEFVASLLEDSSDHAVEH